MKEHIIFGWTFDQWAIAAARYDKGINHLPPFERALKVKMRWVQHNLHEPGEIKIFGVPAPIDPEFSLMLFQSSPAMNLCRIPA